MDDSKASDISFEMCTSHAHDYQIHQLRADKCMKEKIKFKNLSKYILQYITNRKLV